MAQAFVEIPLSGEAGADKVTLIDPEDYDWVSRRRVSLGSHRYAQVYSDDGRVTTLHREIVGLATGDPRQVDHINRDRLDNRRANLRVVTQTVNAGNMTPTRGPFTRGTTRHPRGGWIAQAKRAGRHIYIGRFATQREAWEAAEIWRRANISHYIPQDS